MSKILQGITNSSKVIEGKRGALIGAGIGYALPDTYNTHVADRFGAPRVEPRQEKVFKAPEWSPILPGQEIPAGELNDVTTLGGAWLGHHQQKNMAAKTGSPEAQRIQQSLNQTPAANGPLKMLRPGDRMPKPETPTVEPIAKDKVSGLKKLGKVGGILGAGVAGYYLLEPYIRKILSNPIAYPQTPPPSDTDKDCNTLDPSTGRKWPVCDEMKQHKSNILEGMYIAEKRWKERAVDYVMDLYRKRRGQATTKDAEDFLRQHGNQPASVILKPSGTGRIGNAEPITFNDIAGWEKLSKAQQKDILDKLGTKLDKLSRNQQRALIATLVPAAVGGVGAIAKYSTDAKFDELVSDLEAERQENNQLGPDRKNELQPAPRDETPPAIDKPTPAETPPAEVVAEPPAATTPEASCIVKGEPTDLSPEECAKWKEMSNGSVNENSQQNINTLISLIAKANNLSDPNLIRAGQQLKLPGDQLYTVKSGDNLTKIAKRILSRPPQSEPMRTVTVSTPRISQKYPDSGVKPGQEFSDPRNNPGNLRFFKNLNKQGYVLDKAIGVDKNGFAVFSTPEDGLDAMRRQIAIDAKKGLTGRQFIAKYAPAADSNDPEVYTKNVFGELGLDPDQPLNPELIPLIQPLMIRQEHGIEGMYYYMPQTDPRNRVAQVNEMEILQRFLDKQIEKGAKAQAEKDKQKAASEKPVPNPNARYAKPGEPKSAPYDISEPPKTYSDAEIAAIALPKDIEDAKKLKKVPENKIDAVKKIIGTGRFVVFNPSTGLRLQTNDVNKAVNAAQLMAKKDLDRPTMVYDKQTKFPVAAYRGAEDVYLQRDIRHESKSYKKK